MNSPNAKFWIWLSQALGYDTPKVKVLRGLYPDIAVFYSGGEHEWRYCGKLSEKDIASLSKTPLSVAESILESCARFGYSVLAIDDPNYPKCLYNIYDPPAVLYIEGKLPDVDHRLTIGIVGTRRATEYGVSNSYKIGYALGKYGVCTVSGGALGVDCAAHRGTLAADGTTICVRGCGINCSYLSENAGMRRTITQKGAVISEYPPYTEPRSFHFPARNRIISALSDGVVIIESGKRSGSLITANLALEQGKEVFALLGNNSPQNEGSNARIKEGSAIPITDFMDILNAFDGLYLTDEEEKVIVDLDSISLADINAVPIKGKRQTPAEPIHELFKTARSRTKQTEQPKPTAVHRVDVKLEGDMAAVYRVLTDQPVNIDDISRQLSLPVYRVLTAMTQLQMKDLVNSYPGRKFSLK